MPSNLRCRHWHRPSQYFAMSPLTLREPVFCYISITLLRPMVYGVCFDITGPVFFLVSLEDLAWHSLSLDSSFVSLQYVALSASGTCTVILAKAWAITLPYQHRVCLPFQSWLFSIGLILHCQPRNFALYVQEIFHCQPRKFCTVSPGNFALSAQKNLHCQPRKFCIVSPGNVALSAQEIL